jgi:hypothetical protein
MKYDSKIHHTERFTHTRRQRVSQLVHRTVVLSKYMDNHVNAFCYIICHYYRMSTAFLVPYHSLFCLITIARIS